MFIEIDVRTDRGPTATGIVALNFTEKVYCVEQSTGWGRIAFSSFGSLALGPGRLVLTDQNSAEWGNRIVLDGAPASEAEAVRSRGTGRVEKAINSTFTGAAVSWKVTSLSPLRSRILQVVDSAGFGLWPAKRDSFPSGPPSDKTIAAVAEAQKKAGQESAAITGKVTNCGQFPGWVAERIGGKVPGDLFKIYRSRWGDIALKAKMTAWDLYAQTVEKSRGTQGAIWRPWYRGGGRPLPGDVYVLAKTPGGEFAHVGIVVDSSTNVWITADCGQGDGYAGAKQRRQWESYTGALTLLGTGLVQPDAGTRFLLGWINMDALIPEWAP